MKNKAILTGILLISASNMARIGAAFGTITITSYPIFQWFEVLSLVCFILVEGFIAHDASKSLATLAKKEGTLHNMDKFIFHFQWIGLVFLGLVFPIVGGIVWVAMTEGTNQDLLWTIPILACVPIAVALHGMSDIILPKALTKPEVNRTLTLLYQNGKTPLQIANELKIGVTEVEEIESKAIKRFNQRG